VSFARHIGQLTSEQMSRLQYLSDTAHWRDIPARHYITADVPDFWEPCNRAFFILVPPKGEIHRHNDEAIKGITHHLVLKSNPKALNWWIDEKGDERSIHLEEGHRYIVERDPVHWATNEGETARIHLLVEYG
jgi:hypothetical protein